MTTFGFFTLQIRKITMKMLGPLPQPQNGILTPSSSLLLLLPNHTLSLFKINASHILAVIMNISTCLVSKSFTKTHYCFYSPCYLTFLHTAEMRFELWAAEIQGWGSHPRLKVNLACATTGKGRHCSVPCSVRLCFAVERITVNSHSSQLNDGAHH